MSIGFKKPVYGKIYFIALQRPYSGTLRMHLQCIILNCLNVELYMDYKLLNQIYIAVGNYNIIELMVIFCDGTQILFLAWKGKPVL